MWHLVADTACDLYTLDGGEGALYDPWDNKYEMEAKGKKIVIKSAGEDGEMGTGDDIRSDVKKKAEKD